MAFARPCVLRPCSAFGRRLSGGLTAHDPTVNFCAAACSGNRFREEGAGDRLRAAGRTSCEPERGRQGGRTGLDLWREPGSGAVGEHRGARAEGWRVSDGGAEQRSHDEASVFRCAREIRHASRRAGLEAGRYLQRLDWAGQQPRGGCIRRRGPQAAGRPGQGGPASPGGVPQAQE